MNTIILTAEDFPASPLAFRSNNLARLAAIAEFAHHQAEAATAAARGLDTLWRRSSTSSRADILRTIHDYVTHWRYQLAVKAPGHNGAGIPYDPERFRTPIGTKINYDRIGAVGRLRDGATWDEATRTYVGGQDTPAYLAMLYYGTAATARFARAEVPSEVIHNVVTLPDGRRLSGNKLFRGVAAASIAEQLRARIAARGLDASRVETGGNPIYTATPDPRFSDALFGTALDLLARPGCTRAEFRLARYCLFQAPRTKKGSDTVSRTFTAAVGAVLFGADAPALPADIDLRCYVLGQTAATAEQK